MRYQLEAYPNPHAVAIHVDKRIIENVIVCFDSKSSDFADQPNYVKEIFQIEGIKSVTLHQYEICLYKANLFEWSDLIPCVMSILSSTFGESDGLAILLKTLGLIDSSEEVLEITPFEN